MVGRRPNYETPGAVGVGGLEGVSHLEQPESFLFAATRFANVERTLVL
jgi:hypothetical protein